MPRRLTTEEFIQKARDLHGDYYDYSKVDYRGGKVPIEVGCPKHGFFIMNAPEGHIFRKVQEVVDLVVTLEMEIGVENH